MPTGCSGSVRSSRRARCSGSRASGRSTPASSSFGVPDLPMCWCRTSRVRSTSSASSTDRRTAVTGPARRAGRAVAPISNLVHGAHPGRGSSGARVLMTRFRAARSMSVSSSKTVFAASPSGMKLSALDTRVIGPRKPASTRAVTIPSPTPPACRVSSATSTRPVAVDSRTMSSTGSGATNRRSTTREVMPSTAEAGWPLANSCAARSRT